MGKTLAVFVAVLTAVSGLAGEFSRICCDVSSLTPERRFVGDLLKTRIAERTPMSDAAAELKVGFAIDKSIDEERAVVTVSGNGACVRAGRFRGLVFGAGALLRAIRYGERTFRLEDGTREVAPEKPFRGVYFARHFDNWFHRAPTEEFVRYVEDLALWGVNAFHMQLAYPAADLATATKDDTDLFDATSRALSDRIAEMDLVLSSIGGGNTAPIDMPARFRAVPGPHVKGLPEYSVCPEKPGALAYLEAFRQKALDRETELGLRVTGYSYWPYDEGGCDCEKCSVWGGVGYPKLITRLHEINERHANGACHLVSCWYFEDEDWKAFYRYLETEKPDWIDYLVIGHPHAGCPRYTFEHPVPGNIPVITFPEISMWGRAPWGGYGATVLAKRMEDEFRIAERHVRGCVQYSEGIYEDLNKIVVNGLYVKPAASAEEILREYAAYEFPGANPDDFAKLCDLLEQNHAFPRKHLGRPVLWNLAEDDAELKGYRTRAEAAKRLAEKMNREMLRTVAGGWRWRLVYLRALIDREMFARREAVPETARAWLEELVKHYHAEIQLAKWRRARGGYTCPHLREAGTHDHARPVCEFGALPTELRAAAERFVREVSRRTKVSDDAPPLRLEIGVDAAHVGDPCVCVKGGTAKIVLGTASDASRAVDGLLRRMRYWPKRFSVADGEFAVSRDEARDYEAVREKFAGRRQGAVDETAVRRFCAYELPGSDPDDLVRLAKGLDDASRKDLVRLADKIENELSPAFKGMAAPLKRRVSPPNPETSH